MKRLAGVIVLFLGCILLFYGSVSARSTYFKERYRVEQVIAQAPEVKVYLTGNRVGKGDHFTAQISGSEGNTDLAQQSCKRFQESGEGIHYVILLDNSKSVDVRQFQQAKKELVRLRRKIGRRDSMILYTVGASRAGGDGRIILNRGSGAKDRQKDVRRIQSLSYGQAQTVLYRTLTKVLNRLSNKKKRTVLLLMTDGEDDSQGLYNQTYEVNDAIKKAQIPVYGILLRNILPVSARNQRKIKNTRDRILGSRMEKEAQGYCGVTCRRTMDVHKEFDRLWKIWQKQTYVVRFRAPNNRENPNAKLVLTPSAGKTIICQMEYSSHVRDVEAPELSDIQEIDGRRIRVRIADEDGEVLGAETPSNYLVTLRKDKKRIWDVERVVSEGEGVYTLQMKDTLENGEYELSCIGITDDSEEENVLDGTWSLTITKGLNPRAESVKRILKSYWWVLLLLIVSVAGAGVIITLRMRPGKETTVIEEIRDESVTADVRMTVTDYNGVVKEQTVKIDGSTFFGRSAICGVVFDDDLLSKQQFVVDATKKGFFISDLNSTNGTFVNGIRLAERRELADGDVIIAGREKIIFHMMEQSGYMEEVGGGEDI